MTIEKTEIEDTSAKEAEEEATREAERKAELEAAREEARQAKLQAAKAEGAAEALKLGLNKEPVQTAWTDEQWEMEGQKNGMTGQQLKASVLVAKSVADASLKPIKDEAEAAKREAREAREELKRLRERKNVDSIEEDFYDKNPALKNHRKEVKEFLSTYPDNDSIDEKTLAKRLELATKYVKGTVKENMRTSKTSESGSSRMEVDEGRESEDMEFDPKGTGNEGAARLMYDVHRSFGTKLKHSDSLEVWKKSKDDEDRGVSISMDEDLERYRKFADRDIVGGKRG